MNTTLLYLLLLLIGAFLISFLIGWIIRRSSYKKRYENDIDTLHDIVDEHDVQVRNNSLMLTKKNEESSIVENDLKTKKVMLENYGKEYNSLKTEFTSLENEKVSIEKGILEHDKKINVLTNEFEVLKKEEGSISGDIEKLTTVQSSLDAKLEEIKDVESKIDTLTKEKEILSNELHEVEDSIKSVEGEISEQNSKISEITKKINEKKNALKGELEDTRTRSLNYEYAIKHVKEKMDANEKIDFDVVDQIIMKNDEKGIFSNFFKKIFRKSTDYIKRGQ
jgi:chromosome segregation ATPase